MNKDRPSADVTATNSVSSTGVFSKFEVGPPYHNTRIDNISDRDSSLCHRREHAVTSPSADVQPHKDTLRTESKGDTTVPFSSVVVDYSNRDQDDQEISNGDVLSVKQLKLTRSPSGAASKREMVFFLFLSAIRPEISERDCNFIISFAVLSIVVNTH